MQAVGSSHHHVGHFINRRSVSSRNTRSEEAECRFCRLALPPWEAAALPAWEAAIAGLTHAQATMKVLGS